ncbi:Reverse transcriptase domain [Arabidopsis thaliana x Arabidopsis arenosa]|uniref:Reverse transcriptase domain n=1 Tax=Arabidopsis thaliana x Arabidopsis arenosa TaxID=1240361 RepID=A0A8T1YDL6_9BRAS|nr:Reverse transcriptase domain [Arabidopsis thaliana x Arabidopsis arenosa]
MPLEDWSRTGVVITNAADIKQAAVNHFQQFLQLHPEGVELPSLPQMEELLDYRCTTQQSSDLVRPITAAEIKSVVFAMPRAGSTFMRATSNSGLRQGCALSPYLYVLASNMLSRMLNKAAKMGKINLHPHCRRVEVTHLSFANDILIFSDGSPSSIAGIVAFFDEFAVMSGLRINESKSSIFTAGKEKHLAVHAASTHGICSSSLPIRYLGLPLTTWSMTRLDYEPLIDKIKRRMLSWLPQQCLDKIESLCSAFLWSGSPYIHSKAKVAWEDVCLPKEEGGSVIRRLQDSSRVYSLSLIWRLLTSSGSLWVAWTREHLLYSTIWRCGSNGPRSSKAGHGSDGGTGELHYQNRVWIYRSGVMVQTSISQFFQRKTLRINSEIERTRFSAWGVIQPLCFCGEPNESRDHLFFACLYTFSIWSALTSRILGRMLSPDWSRTLTSIRSSRLSKQDNTLLRMIFQSTLYLVWRERNGQNHNNGSNAASVLVNMIDKIIRDRISTLPLTTTGQLGDLHHRWAHMRGF